MGKNLKRSIKFFLFSLFLLQLILPKESQAWGGDVHAYLCPAGVDCNLADSREFKTAYEWDNWGHMCLDNQPDCLARLGAKYFLKKYYLEGKKDWKLLAAAAHLYQDSTCPDHWYPMREYFGKIIVPLAPSWVTKVEGEVSGYLSFRPGPGGASDNWNIPIRWHNQTMNVNKSYIDGIKESLKTFIANEPREDIGALKKQIDAKMTWTMVRSYKEIALLILLIMSPIWLYTLFILRKNGKKTDFIITSCALGLLLLYLMIIQFVWRG